MTRLATSALLLAVFLIAAPKPAAARNSGDPKTILVIHTYGHDIAGRVPFDAGIVRALREADVPTDLYIETLDPNRFRGDLQPLTTAYLRDKYAGKKLDVVVAVYGVALDFLLAGSQPTFPGVPIVATFTRRPEHVPNGVAFTWSGNVVRDTLAAALAQNPKASQIAIIDGGPLRTERDELGREIRFQVESLKTSLPVTYFQDLPLDDLLTRLQALPSDAVILLTRQFLGIRGEPIAHLDAVRQVVHATAAPVYVTTDGAIGTGAVGGVVLNYEDIGAKLGSLAVRVAITGSSDVPPSQDRLTPTFDWRQLQRRGIGESRLPPGSVVLFRELSLWEQYGTYIAIATVVITLQTSLIVGLIVMGTLRRRSERALMAREQDLRRSYDENRDLAGRLIDAQEQERTRIARDLHDDVSQQLAALSIVISSLRHKAGKGGGAGAIDAMMGKLQERTAALAQAIRTLSHQLHPSVLQHAGLVATLQRHCADVGHQHAIDVRFRAEGDFDNLDESVVLCVFRVAQESISNAVKHSRAKTIAVQLSAGSESVELRVSDAGLGFAADVPAAGLGLRSINERVRLLRGEVIVDSRPGSGTLIFVRLPRHLVSPLTANGEITTYR